VDLQPQPLCACTGSTVAPILTARLYTETSEGFSTKREADESPSTPQGPPGGDPRRANPVAAPRRMVPKGTRKGLGVRRCRRPTVVVAVPAGAANDVRPARGLAPDQLGVGQNDASSRGAVNSRLTVAAPSASVPGHDHSLSLGGSADGVRA
jgi:hypothetical protein